MWAYAVLRTDGKDTMFGDFGHEWVVFFQAEDGIRDYKVTGVQTCALPIWPRRRDAPSAGRPRLDPAIRGAARSGPPPVRRRPRLGKGAARVAVAGEPVAELLMGIGRASGRGRGENSGGGGTFKKKR